MTYKSTLNNAAKITTLIVTVLFAFSIVTSAWLFAVEGGIFLLLIAI